MVTHFRWNHYQYSGSQGDLFFFFFLNLSCCWEYLNTPRQFWPVPADWGWRLWVDNLYLQFHHFYLEWCNIQWISVLVRLRGCVHFHDGDRVLPADLGLCHTEIPWWGFCRLTLLCLSVELYNGSLSICQIFKPLQILRFLGFPLLLYFHTSYWGLRVLVWGFCGHPIAGTRSAWRWSVVLAVFTRWSLSGIFI